MIELAESKTLEMQANSVLIGKRVKKVYAPTSPHKFCWFAGSPENYDRVLKGAIIIGAIGHGMFLDLQFESVTLSINDGTNIRYVENTAKRQEKYQLLIEFDDDSTLVFTVAMYGGIYLHQNYFDNKYYQGSLKSVSPLSDNFDERYFEKLLNNCNKDLSMKAFLATEQRIPGLGNGSLQDILLTCGLHPKRKMSTLSQHDRNELFYSVKAVLQDMLSRGGRNTERDLFGDLGKYQTLLSKNAKQCVLCGDCIIKESYLGGSIYYCPTCQKLKPEIYE